MTVLAMLDPYSIALLIPIILATPLLNDYVELAAIAALIAVVYQIWNEKEERKADVSSLRQQTAALENIATNGQKQTEILIAQNGNLEYQNNQLTIQVKLFGDFLETFSTQSTKDEESRKRTEYFESERKRAEVMPHFFPNSWSVNYDGLSILIQNRGGVAQNLKVIKDSGNILINPFNSVRIEKDGHVTIAGKLTSYAEVPENEYPPGKTPVLLVLQFEDIYRNVYKQGFDFPNGMRSQPFFSSPDLVERPKG